MARNRVQFQKCYGLTQFVGEYGTEEKCMEALFRWRWPNGTPFTASWPTASVSFASRFQAVDPTSRAPNGYPFPKPDND